MEILLKELDCSRMLVNVSKLKPSQDIKKAHPEIFANHIEFALVPDGLNSQYLFRYLCLVYDKNSPLREMFPEDINRMKSTAAQLSGFKKNDSGRFNTVMEEIFVCRNHDINKMIVKYSILSRSTMYVQYVVLSEVYQKESLNLLSGAKTKIDDFQKIGSELEIVRTEILNQDNNARLEASFVEFYIKDKLELRPEDIAKKIRNGELVSEFKEDIS
jgi:hypothetical protein